MGSIAPLGTVAVVSNRKRWWYCLRAIAVGLPLIWFGRFITDFLIHAFPTFAPVIEFGSLVILVGIIGVLMAPVLTRSR